MSDGSADAAEDPITVRLLMADDQNERLLSNWLSERYAVESNQVDLDGSFDLAIVDAETFRRVGPEAFSERKEREEPVVLPVLLIAGERLQRRPTVWNHVDDIITTPIEQNVLQGRIGALLRTRRLSATLARQNEQLDKFASVVSHDLRNPLTVAKGHLEMLDSQEDGNHVETIDRSLTRMEALIEDMLALTRQETAVEATEVVSLAETARQAWGHVETTEGSLEVGGDVTLSADESRLVQLFENLFRNAVEHGDSTVTVTVEPLAESEGFAIADDGPGIDPEKRETVFDSGYTTSKTGTGLGLDIVQTIAEAHGWRIDVGESDTGGARFEITGVDSD